jgi:hypothetical protein
MRRTLLVVVAILAIGALAAPSVIAARQPQSSVPGDASLLAAREAAWRDWFGANPAIEQVLPANFVAIYPNDSMPSDRAKTLSGSKQSKASGREIVSLAFPRDVIQRHGNVAVLHSRYVLTLREQGKPVTRKGWITETFYWDGARWMHPSWHMSDDGCCGK